MFTPTTKVSSRCSKLPHLQRLVTTTTADSRVPLAYELHRPKKSDSATKKPIIFMHGFLGSKRENRGISRLLAQDLERRVFAVDLRNHGDSAHHPKHDYIELARDVEAFIRDHQLTSPTLIGHSMGAKTAMTLGLLAPEMVSDVVAIDNAPIQLPLGEDFSRFFEGMAKVEEASIKTHLEGDKILKDYEKSAIIRLFLLSNFIRDPASSYLRLRIPLSTLKASFGDLGDFPLQNRSSHFSKPTLILRALQSHYIPQDVFPLIFAMFPRAQIVDIDSGHWMVEERPEETRQAIVEFLRPENRT